MLNEIVIDTTMSNQTKLLVSKHSVCASKKPSENEQK